VLWCAEVTNKIARKKIIRAHYDEFKNTATFQKTSCHCQISGMLKILTGMPKYDKAYILSCLPET